MHVVQAATNHDIANHVHEALPEGLVTLALIGPCFEDA